MEEERICHRWDVQFMVKIRLHARLHGFDAVLALHSLALVVKVVEIKVKKENRVAILLMLPLRNTVSSTRFTARTPTIPHYSTAPPP